MVKQIIVLYGEKTGGLQVSHFNLKHLNETCDVIDVFLWLNITELWDKDWILISWMFKLEVISVVSNLFQEY